ncbi:MAG: transposase [Actinomycetota bacterium]|nr:transposase [Actinomycetota bacterium]
MRPRWPQTRGRSIPAACHIVEQFVNNPVEANHGRLKARLRPMRGLKRLRLARVISAGHAFLQNLRRGHYELGGRRPVTVEPGSLGRSSPPEE